MRSRFSNRQPARRVVRLRPRRRPAEAPASRTLDSGSRTPLENQEGDGRVAVQGRPQGVVEGFRTCQAVFDAGGEEEEGAEEGVASTVDSERRA